MMERIIFTTFLLLLLSSLTCLSAIISSTDQSALLSLKSKIISDPYNVMRSWNITSPVCSWVGVKCGNRRHQRVTHLNISYMNLTGEIPSELGNLSFLISLDVKSNHFSGMLPEDLSRLRRLRYVRITDNSFCGEVPSWFSSLPRLESLNLNNNSFTSLDSLFFSYSNQSKLDTLDVSFNSLQGGIPESIGNLHGLKHLIMAGNKLSGRLPSSLANLTRLVSLSMPNNCIEGSLPEWIANLRSLSFLDLRFNRLVGSISSRLFNMSTLQHLVLRGNSLSGSLRDDMCLHLPLLREVNLANNELYGEIPSNISLCSQLRVLSLSSNNFTGSIPEKLGNLQMLRELSLAINNLTGEIPHALGELVKLEILDLAVNELTGSVPENIYNITSLKKVALAVNKLSGNLPSKPGNVLPNLEKVYVRDNDFSGVFPSSILNSSKLILLELSHNKLTGSIPASLGDLRFLQVLRLDGNGFTSTGGLSFIDSLTNCRYLSKLSLSDNPLNGVLPPSIGNFSSSLSVFEASNGRIRGNIPSEIGNLSGLITLSLAENGLSGEIPRTLYSLVNLQRLSLGDNQIKGFIPNRLCRLTSLGFIDLHANQLAGHIPECFGNISSLRDVYLYSNNLTSLVPSSIWNLKDLIHLSIYSNSFTGFLSPDIGNLKAAISIDLSMNKFFGDIPDEFEGLTQLQHLHIASNNFNGPIPESMGRLVSLVSLNLSQNMLNGSVPKSFEALRYLQYFNVSHNELSGEIPSNGPFVNFTSGSFAFNTAFCGPSRFNVSSCPELSHKSKMKKMLLRSLFIFIVIFITCSTYAALRYRRKMNYPALASSNIPRAVHPMRFSYYDLLHATENYSESNLLGKGCFSSVYKSVLRDGTVLAVKVFHIQLEGSLKSFEVECEVLRNLRHRNLVRVIGCCTNQDFKAIVLEYMENGSLAKCLYAKNRFVDVIQRLDIMIDVARALEYLHHGNPTSLVHCDLKPENVLLDKNMVAHVSDFGITKYLDEEESVTSTRTLATLGYMAPEYGSDGIVSTRCDVYSYGIMLLETFTRRRPSDRIFYGDVTLKDWIRISLPSALMQVVDATLISPEEKNVTEKLQSISSVLELGLRCSSNSLRERKNMKDVYAEMTKIRTRLMASI